MTAMTAVIELGRSARERREINLKTPLKSLTVVTSDKQTLADVQSLEVSNAILNSTTNKKNHCLTFTKYLPGVRQITIERAND
jgi:hypothetical protein